MKPEQKLLDSLMGITVSMPNCVAYNTFAGPQVPLASELVLDSLVFSKLAGGGRRGTYRGGLWCGDKQLSHPRQRLGRIKWPLNHPCSGGRNLRSGIVYKDEILRGSFQSLSRVC